MPRTANPRHSPSCQIKPLRVFRHFDHLLLPEPAKPVIPAQHVAEQRRLHPPARPLHCPAWMEARQYGWVIRYPWRTVITIRRPRRQRVVVTFARVDANELWDATPVVWTPQACHGAHTSAQDPASTRRTLIGVIQDHFSLATGLVLRTQPGVLSFLTAPPHQRQPFTVVNGLVETDWYPHSLFPVFQWPRVGETLTFRRGDALCHIVPVVRQSDWRVEAAQPDEYPSLVAEQGLYLQQGALTEQGWEDARGMRFTRLYAKWARHIKHEGRDWMERTLSQARVEDFFIERLAKAAGVRVDEATVRTQVAAQVRRLIAQRFRRSRRRLEQWLAARGATVASYTEQRVRQQAHQQMVTQFIQRRRPTTAQRDAPITTAELAALRREVAAFLNAPATASTADRCPVTHATTELSQRLNRCGPARG